MRILLNDRELPGLAVDGATLGKALTTLEANHIGCDEVIASILIDGEPLTAERLSDWTDRPVDDFGEAKVESDTRNGLASKALRVVAAGLAQSQADRDQIVEHICQGRTDQAMKKLTGYLDVWSGVHKNLACACRLMGMEEDALVLPAQAAAESSGSDIQSRLAQLTEHLGQIKSALQNGDLVLLGDILDYEFGEMTDQWVSLLEQVADSFEADLSEGAP